MRPVSLTFQGVTAEVSGGWILPSPSDDAEMSIRLDDGKPATCVRDDRMMPGDRVYRVLYTGRALRRRAGTELHDVTADLVQRCCSLSVMRTSYVYAGMAAVPALLLCILLAIRLGLGDGSVSGTMLTVTASSLAVPVGLWAMQSRLTRRDNLRHENALRGCRRVVGEAIAHDVAAWKARLDEALPGMLAPVAGTFIRGTACRIVEGVASVSGGTTLILRPGRSIEIPFDAVDLCTLEDGDLVHALIPAGRIPATPLAVANPVTGTVWTDDAMAGGPDGTTYRALMRAVLGRAAWNLVMRQWDEIGQRRRSGIRA